MKQFLLTGLAIATLSLSATAQTRMTLSEEFTGENCGPCAATNPSFWHLCDTAPNLSKIIHLSYMCPIPSSGWFYMQTQTLSDARASYYTVPFAPYHRYDGHVPNPSASSPGHPGNFTQADIDAEYAITSPFNITASNAWNATYDSVITTVNISCVSAWTGGTVYLRAALAQTVIFATAPGSNGETHFENVVRAMYPDATGTSLGSTWTAGMTQTVVLRGAVPSFVERDKSPFMTVWIQDDASSTKYIAQAAKANPLPPIPNDGAIANLVTPGLTCQPNAPYSAVHSVILKNAGSNAITSATIYYKADNATTWSNYAWTGSLAVAGTTSVTMPAASVTVSGAFYHSFYDSVDNVNGAIDQNMGNNTRGKSYFIESTVGLTMPYTTSFESADLGKFYYTDANDDTRTWGAWQSGSGSLGHTGSIAEKFDCFNFGPTVGETEVLTLPEVVTSSPSAVDFWVAYKQYTTENDKLEVVYSTNCGSSWTSLWSKSGTALATGAATTSSFTPTAADYRMKSVDISTVPAGSIIGFRATSDFGNNIWIDDITVRAGAPVAVENVNAAASVEMNIFPNPATTQATVEFSLTQSSDVNVTVTDQLGRVVNTVANGKMEAGSHSLTINTAALAQGLYNVTVRTEGGVYTQHMSVAK